MLRRRNNMELDAICLRKNGPIKEDIGFFYTK